MKRGLALVGMALLVLVPLAISWSTRDVQEEPAELVGRLWRGDAAGAVHVVFVTREQRAVRVYLGGSRYSDWRYDPYTRFTLDVRRMPDGAVVRSLRLADMQQVDDLNAPRVLGVAGDVLWTWRDSVEAWRLPDLAPLRVARSDLLPREPEGYRVRPDSAALVARGRDARYYTVHPDGRAATPLDAATLPAASWDVTSPEDRFDRMLPPGRSLSYTSPGTMTQRSFLTSTGLWYALLSESERATLSRWPSGNAHPTGRVARVLHRTPYRLDDRKAPEIDPARAVPLGGERLIEAGFLERTRDRVWDVADPSSTLVLARAAVGAREPWDLVRLARDGRVLWRTTTELADPQERLDLGTHVLFAGHEIGSGQAGGGRPRDLLVWIDERTGARRTLSVPTGDVR